MSFHADPLQGAPMRVADTFARALHSGNACMNECPSVPHGSEQEEEEETRDRGGVRRGTKGDSSGSFSFSTAAGTRRALSALTCPHVDPSRELSDLTWSSSKRFSPSVPPPPPYPVFFRPQKWLRRFNMAVFVSFFLALACFSFFLFFFLRQKGGRGALRIQWRLSISDESFVVVCGWAFILFDQRASVSFERKGIRITYNRPNWDTRSIRNIWRNQVILNFVYSLFFLSF